MKKTLVFLTISSLAISCAPASSPPPPAAAAAPATSAPAPSSEAFSKFVDDFFDARFAYLPSQATEDGFHQYDSKLEDRSRARIEARIAELKGFLARVQAMDRAGLSFDDRIDADAIEGQIRGQLLDQETLRNWERNPMGYAGLPGSSADGLIKRDFAPAAERLRALISREKLMPAIYAAGKANLVNPPREFTDLAIRISKGSAGYFSGTVAEWAKVAAGGDAALAKEFADANGAVVAATRDFAAWLEKDLLPRSKGNYAIGAANFLAKMKYDERVEMPLPDLLARGEAQLAKDYAAFVETAKKIDPSKTPAQVMTSLSDDHPTPETLIPTVDRSVEDARRFLVQKDLVTIPSEVRPRVQETPPFARSGSFASMDTPGAFETKATEAFYYVTPVEKDWDAKHKEEHLRLYNPYVVAMIDVHEVWPGHYLQFLYAPRFPTKTRKLDLLRHERGGVGALQRADDGRRGFRRRRSEVPPRAAPGSPAPRLPVRRRDQAPHAGNDGGGGREGLRREGIPGAGQRLRGSATRGLQPDVPLLHARQAGDPGALATSTARRRARA